MLADKPYKHVMVKNHVFKLEILLVLILVDESSLKLSLLANIELLDLDLLCEVHPVL